MTDYNRAGTYTCVSARAAGAYAYVLAFDSNEDRSRRVSVSIDAHLRTEAEEQASWTCAVTAASAADLLELFAPVVDRLRALAADELVEQSAK